MYNIALLAYIYTHPTAKTPPKEEEKPTNNEKGKTEKNKGRGLGHIGNGLLPVKELTYPNLWSLKRQSKTTNITNQEKKEHESQSRNQWPKN